MGLSGLWRQLRASKLMASFLLLLAIPLLALGWYGLRVTKNAAIEDKIEALKIEVSGKTAEVERYMAAAASDLLFLRQTPPIQGISRARSGGGFDSDTNSSYEQWVDRLEAIFSSLAQAKPFYAQLRYLDETGQELVRVDSDGTAVKVISHAELQNKSQRPYFLQTMQLEESQLYVSPLNLNVEHGKIVIPHVPVIRYAIPIFGDAHQRKGILVSNLFAQPFLDRVKALPKDERGMTFLVNQEGFYLAHPDTSKEWGADLGTNERLDRAFPKEAASRILSGTSGSLTQGLDDFVVYQPIFPDPGDSGTFWVLARLTPQRAVTAAFTDLMQLFGLLVLVGGLVVGSAWLVYMRKIVRPVNRIIEANLAISDGDERSMMIPETEIPDDEFGQIMRSRNTMLVALRQAKDYSDNIIKSMIDTLIVVSPDGKVQAVNTATCALLGHEEKELVGQPVSRIFAEEEEEEEEALFSNTQLNKLIKQGSITNYDLTYLTKNKQKIPVNFSGSVMRGPQDKVLGIVGVARDMRETRRLIAEAAAAGAQREKAAQLEQAFEKLDAAHRELKSTQAQLIQAGKLAAMGQLGAGIAHELNQPITSIQGFAQRIRREVSGTTADEIEIILNAAHRMARIVGNIRAFARQSEFKLEPINALAPFDDALMLLSEQLRVHGVEVEKTVQEGLPLILADKIRLQQVFLNLLANARDALNELPKGKRKHLALGVGVDGNQVVYTVEDNGPGVPEASESLIFDPFFTTKPPGKGTGLGLSLSYGIVSDHGGEITYQRAASGGALFTVRIPLAPDDTGNEGIN